MSQLHELLGEGGCRRIQRQGWRSTLLSVTGLAVPGLRVLLCALKLATLRTDVAQCMAVVTANLTSLGSTRTLRGWSLGRRPHRHPKPWRRW